MISKKIVLAYLLLLGGVSAAQDLNQQANLLLSQGLKLYQQQHYSAAAIQFDKVLEKARLESIVEKAKFYKALSFLSIDKDQAALKMELFLNEYPQSIYANRGRYSLAHFYFNSQQFSRAFEQYQKVQTAVLSDEEQAIYDFEFGYSLFLQKKYDQAEQRFGRISKNSTKYDQARFYRAYIAYQKNELLKAKQWFELPFKDKNLESKSAYYKSDISFRENRFQEAILKAEKYLPQATKSERVVLYKIVGVSYFQLKKYQEAISYLNKYKDAGGAWGDVDKYQMGYSYYMLQKYHEAIGLFNTIVGGKNALAQNAYYHLGACYVALDLKQEALNAFRVSYELGFSKEIALTSQYQYARLSYDIGNPYEGAISALSNFISTYPHTRESIDVKKLLVKSYAASNDFESALLLIQEQPDLANAEVLQQVNYLKAEDLLKSQQIDDSKRYFEQAYDALKTSVLAARSLFWLSETQYIAGEYQLALQSLLRLEKNPKKSSIPEYRLIAYQRGSLYFQMKRYSEAIEYFEEFIKLKDHQDSVYLDALLRLGDAFYVTNGFERAITTYKKVIAIHPSTSDYAAYRIAMSYGFMQQNSQKITALKQWLNQYKDSHFIDQVMFELANTYAQTLQTDLALNTYEELMHNYSKSPWISQAMLRKGLLYYSLEDTENALSLFKELAFKFPKTEEAIQGVQTVKRIYVDLGDLKSYTDWVSELDFINETEGELDKASYESASQLLLKGDKDKALKALEYYVATYPKGHYQLESRFELAKIFQEQQNFEKAIPLLEWMVQEPSKYLEESLVRLSQIFRETQEHSKALATLTRLEQIANRIDNEHYAQANLMRTYYDLKEYDNAVLYAQKLMDREDLSAALQLDAQIVFARCKWISKEYDASIKAYEYVEKNATGALIAEAMYYRAVELNRTGAFKESNSKIQDLAKKYPAYKIWAAKGLVLMSDNFVALKDTFQAHYILTSVRDHFSQFPEIVLQVKDRIRELTPLESSEKKSTETNQIKNDSIHE